jgi:hypothetical protein
MRVMISCLIMNRLAEEKRSLLVRSLEHGPVQSSGYKIVLALETLKLTVIAACTRLCHDATANAAAECDLKILL